MQPIPVEVADNKLKVTSVCSHTSLPHDLLLRAWHYLAILYRLALALDTRSHNGKVEVASAATERPQAKRCALCQA